MKNFVTLAKKTVYDKDGFLQGFLKGAAICGIMIVVVNAFMSFN